MKTELRSHETYYCQLDGYALLKVSGSDATQFLQGQTTCDITILNEEQSSLGACCDRKGRILFNFRIFLKNNDYFLHLPKSILAAASKHLQKYIIISKVKLSTAEQSSIGLGGEHIMQWLKTQFAQVPIQLGAVYQNEQESLICVDEKKPRYLLINPSLDRLHNLVKIPTENWEFFNLQQGLVNISPETQGLFIPQALAYEQWGAVSFSKGCYVGQEIIARTQHLGKIKRHLHLLQAEQAIPLGSDIFNELNENIGTIAAACVNPQGGYAALGVLQEQKSQNSLHLLDKNINLQLVE